MSRVDGCHEEKGEVRTPSDFDLDFGERQRNRRAHGCVPTAGRTQQRIVTLNERPLIFSTSRVKYDGALRGIHAACFHIHVLLVGS